MVCYPGKFTIFTKHYFLLKERCNETVNHINGSYYPWWKKLENGDCCNTRWYNQSVCYLWIYCFIPSFRNTCCTSFTNVLMIVSDNYCLDVNRNHGLILSNTLSNNYCRLYSPRRKVSINSIFVIYLKL